LALEALLNDVGKASFLLNTIVVGLDAVEKGHEKPDGLNVSWEPKDRKVAARTARKFATEAFIIRAADSLHAYRQAISAFPRFAAICSKWKKTTGEAQKLDDVASNVLDDKDYLIASGMLLLTWRNLIVHNGNLTLHHQKKQILRKNEKIISESYSGLSVDCLLCHASERRPTLKDVSSLIAMSLNLARKLDAAIYHNLTKEDVMAWLEYYSIIPLLKKVHRETSIKRRAASIERVFKTNAPGLYQDFLKFFDPTGVDFVD
jgi:hypothetical protein